MRSTRVGAALSRNSAKDGRVPPARWFVAAVVALLVYLLCAAPSWSASDGDGVGGCPCPPSECAGEGGYAVWLAQMLLAGPDGDYRMSDGAAGDYQLFLEEARGPLYVELASQLAGDPLSSLPTAALAGIYDLSRVDSKTLYEAAIFAWLRSSEDGLAGAYQGSAGVFDLALDLYGPASGAVGLAADGLLGAMVENRVVIDLAEDALAKGLFTLGDGLAVASISLDAAAGAAQAYANALAVGGMLGARVELLCAARDACAASANPDEAFVEACDEVVACIEGLPGDYFGSAAGTEAFNAALDALWVMIGKANPLFEMAAGVSGALFGDAVFSDLELYATCVVDTYLHGALRGSVDRLLFAPGDPGAAQEFVSCYRGYLHWYAYACGVAGGWAEGADLDPNVLGILQGRCESERTFVLDQLGRLDSYADVYVGLYGQPCPCGCNPESLDDVHSSFIQSGAFIQDSPNDHLDSSSWTYWEYAVYNIDGLGEPELIVVGIDEWGAFGETWVYTLDANSQEPVLVDCLATFGSPAYSAEYGALVLRDMRSSHNYGQFHYYSSESGRLERLFSVGYDTPEDERLYYIMHASGEQEWIEAQEGERYLTFAPDFETVQFDRTIGTVSGSSDADRVVVQSSADSQAAYGLYAQLVDSYIAKYGGQQFANIHADSYYASGLCLVDLVDFDGDGRDELLLAYSDPGLRWENDQMPWDPYVTEVWAIRDGMLTCVLQTTETNGSNGGGAAVVVCEYAGTTYFVTGAMDSFDYRNFYAYQDGTFVLASSYECADVGWADEYVNGTLVVDGVIEDPLIRAYLAESGIVYTRHGLNWLRDFSTYPGGSVGDLQSVYQRALATLNGEPNQMAYVTLLDGSTAVLQEYRGRVGDKEGQVATATFSVGDALWDLNGIVRTDSAGDTYLRFSAYVDGRSCEVAWYGGLNLFDCENGYQVVATARQGSFKHPDGAALVPWAVVYDGVHAEGAPTSFFISENPSSPFYGHAIYGDWFIDGDGLWCVRFLTYRGTDLYAYEEVDDQGYRCYSFWTYWGQEVYRVVETDESVPGQPSNWRHAVTGESL